MSGCTPRSLVERAIRARGGPLHGLVRQVEADVQVGFPGHWEWETAFLLPDRYAWTIYTAGEPDHYLYDGHVVRTFVGAGPVTKDASEAAALRTHARFTAVVLLDALRLPGVSVQQEPAPGPEAPAVARVTLADDGSQYRLAFDAGGLLVAATGPLDLSPFGRGEVEAYFGDFQRVGGLLLPFRTDYVFRGASLVSERVVAACPDPPALDEQSFRVPSAVPGCP